MDSLPKRSDDIYKEIESFEDYELTQCVAYEMAIRNDDENFSMIPLWELEKTSNYELSDIDLYGYFSLADKVTSFYPTYIEETKKNAFNLFKEQPDFKHFDEKMLETLFQQSKKYWFNKIANNLEYFIEKFLMNENKEFVPLKLPTLTEDINVDRTLLIEIIKHSNRLKSYQLLKYSRPQITTHLSKVITININIGLPLTELIAQITKIKSNFDNEIVIVKAPIELLGETLEDATPKKDYPKKPTAQKMADMFFIYDYVKVRLKNIQEENKNNAIELEEEIENIKKYHTGADRKKRIAYAKAEHLESNIDTKITDIFKEDELTKILNLSGANISKLYYAIKPYIDDLKYKELITGVSTK
jgi:hypothetical protein